VVRRGDRRGRCASVRLRWRVESDARAWP
jgi:hypothetical protein